MNVRNMETPAGTIVPNQFIVETNTEIWFQSYDTIIVKIKEKGKIFLDYHWDCSKTTGKYRNMFLNESIKETHIKIKRGEYTVTNLN